MAINWFIGVAGILYVLGSAYDWWGGNWKMALIYGAYAISNFVLMTMKGV